MASHADAPRVTSRPSDPGVARQPRPAWRTRLGPLGRISLAGRFLVANLAILLVAGLVVGVWVGDQLERGIVERTASVTALYVESVIEPSLASMSNGSTLTPEEVRALDASLASTLFAERVRSLRVWSPDGEVVYSPDPELVGRRFAVEGHLAKALRGEVVASMDDLSDEENAWERARWDRLLEMYIPVRERGSDRIVAVAEFYLPPADIDRQVGEARVTSWLLVSLTIILSALLLYGIVKRGSDTIERQEAALTAQVDELTTLVERNAALSERVRTAAERSTTLNERAMRRLSSDLHDGPGQMLSLALLRLDGLRRHAQSGQAPGAAELIEVERVLQESMTDMRAIAAGLRMPELATMDTAAIAVRAVKDHERRSGASVDLSVDPGVPAEVPLSVRIALFRALQEALSNATRHGGGAGLTVRLAAETDVASPGSSNAAQAGERLVLEVADGGAGFDPAGLSSSQGLGLAGIREQAELLGGGFDIQSAVGVGTRLRAWWPVHSEEDAG